jgi:alpha-beta hydrolase superfamily lysophospholipase
MILESHPILGTLAALTLTGVLLNAVAFSQAWSMLHFAPEGNRTKPPEQLSWREKLHVLVAGIHLPHPNNDRLPENLSLSSTVHRFPAADGVELEGWWIPRVNPRAVVILFHGWGSVKSTLLEEAKAFHELGMSCFLVDHRGHGGSAGQTTSIGYREAADVLGAVDFVHATLRQGSPVVLYGQSMGGVSIFRALSIDHREPAAVIVEAIYDETLNAVRNRFRSIGLPAFPAAELLCFWGSIQMGFSARRHNPVRYARAVEAPVLMLHGTEDSRATEVQARRVFACLGGKKAFATFEGSTHESLFKRSPEQWTNEVASFLASVMDAEAPVPGEKEDP